MDQHIIPECYIDTHLVKTLEPPTKRYNHQHGCSNVEKAIKRLTGDFALGIVDKDKKALKYLDECQPVCEHIGSLQLLKHKNEHHYLILIKPAMKRWILNTASDANVSITNFGLPSELEKLCYLTKTAKSDRDDPNVQKFGQLFKALRHANPPAVAILTFRISYLKANPYTADLAFLQTETAQLIGYDA